MVDFPIILLQITTFFEHSSSRAYLYEIGVLFSVLIGYLLGRGIFLILRAIRNSFNRKKERKISMKPSHRSNTDVFPPIAKPLAKITVSNLINFVGRDFNNILSLDLVG